MEVWWRCKGEAVGLQTGIETNRNSNLHSRNRRVKRGEKDHPRNGVKQGLLEDLEGE